MTRDRRPATDRLISGKLRGRAGRAGAATSVILVKGTAYAWSYRHGWLVWGKGIRAISISVCLNPERTRELILDFSLRVKVDDASPSEAQVARALEDGIGLALDAGWDPESRGHAFRYEITEPM